MQELETACGVEEITSGCSDAGVRITIEEELPGTCRDDMPCTCRGVLEESVGGWILRGKTLIENYIP
jgi:hypothetical protein